MTYAIMPNAPIPLEISRLTAWAETIGVRIEIDFDAVLHIPYIGRDVEDSSTKGNGKRVLDALLQLADARRLTVEIEHMTDEPELGSYYHHFGFLPYGEPGEITNLRRTPRPIWSADRLPTVSFYKLYHVGLLNPAHKRPNSYEGAGLSVSLHPDDWTNIARLGGNPCWTLTRDENRFLDAHSVSRKLKHAVIEWGLNQGYIEDCDAYRLRWTDAETGFSRHSFFLSKAEAEYESADDGYEDASIKRLNGHKSTPLLEASAQQTVPAIGTEFCLDLLLPLYAEEVLNLDGVWWQDNYDPQNLSAPRGVIAPSRLPLWSVVRSADPDLKIAA